MNLNGTGFWTGLLVLLGSVIAFVLKLIRNKQSHEDVQKTEQDSQTQLQQSVQQAEQALQNELNNINKSDDNSYEDWKEWKKQVSSPRKAFNHISLNFSLTAKTTPIFF
ncbi:MAG: hypothetical protein ACHQ6U_12810 [Thermodesulfobacteriota bacterium]